LPAGELSADWPTHPGYEILEEKGRGGMGVVYKARQIARNRLVALKMIRDSALASRQERGRFRIEAEAAARMRHANIVEIYEVGEHAGRPYFAMELIEGGGLDKHLAGRPQPSRHAATLVRTLALAVQHAHEQKIIHRDLKPANILLAVDSSQLSGVSKKTPGLFLTIDNWQLTTVPRIADFGLAKRLDSESTAWTQDGAVLGTASYMAPEQAAGRVGELGPAVDIYALGGILYELLIGRPAFKADTWNETIQQVLHDEPAPPTRFRPDVQRDLETICIRCLEKEPGRRYASAAELADDLGRFLEDKPVAAVPLGDRERLARVAGRDGYLIVGEIGRGPRSTVYHALYEPLKQPVALKVFQRGAYTREQWEDRLRRGADLWAALAHPQIVPVHRAGWWDGGPYLATEFVPHGSLAAKLTGQPFPIGDALPLVIQLAEIVAYFHRQGVVHGNLKPSNVLLAADGIPRVIDFRLTSGVFLSPLSTNDEISAGIAYVAPELIRDPGAEPRVTTDIYGLGTILYELLTGRPPFAGATAGETLEQITSQDPVAPSQLNSAVTPYLDAVCLRCLPKSPWRRYARAYDVSKYLQRVLDEPQRKPKIS
jgi:serine/threonine protein kinase